MKQSVSTGRRRIIKGAGLGALALAGGHALRGQAGQPAAFDAIVGEGRGHAGVATYATLAQAIGAAPAAGQRPFRILLRRGVWIEKLRIDKPNVHLQGEGAEASIISFGAAAGLKDPSGEPWGTFRSGTVIVTAPGFQARDLTIRNSYGDGDGFDADKMGGRQAVALALNREADRALLERVRLTGRQDTFFLDGARTLVRDSFISGDVDFIFGGSRGVFERCEIQVRYRPDVKEQGYIAAPSTLDTQAVGLVFRQCRLSKEAGVPPGSAFLGRPWRAGNNMAIVPMATYLDCWMDEHIAAIGWTSMNYTTPDGVRKPLMPAEVRFSEFGSRGPGAARHPLRPQLAAGDIAAFSTEAVLQGWSPV